MPKNIFLAFANSLHSPLPSLTREDNELLNVLLSESIKNDYLIIRESNAQAQIINDRFYSIGEMTAVFHYSGHAGSDLILLDDQEIEAQGLAQMLAARAGNGVLKLVVLNGCSTVGQVKLLLELGVPAVIATHAKVNDMKAADFSINFYKNLAADRSILQAYEAAIQSVMLVNPINVNHHEQIRGVDYLAAMQSDEPLWGLFYSAMEAVSINPLPRKQNAYNEAVNKFEVNALLRTTLRNALKSADAIIKLNELSKTEFVTQDEIDHAIVNVLPMPIGEHLRKLFCSTNMENGYDQLSTERVKQLCRVYSTTMNLLSCIVISQLWDEGLPNLPSDLKKLLIQHFHLTSEEREKFDYCSFLLNILSFLDTQPNRQYFIAEMGGFKSNLLPGTVFSEACAYFLNLNSFRVENKLLSDSTATYCEKGEEALSEVFKTLNFLHNYHLTSVQSISIWKYRHERDPSYDHSVVKLMRVGGSEKILYKLKQCLSCQGVVLINGKLDYMPDNRIYRAEGEIHFLNLSPFMVDTSAFENGTKSKIVMFDEMYSDSYSYKDVCKPDSARDNILVESKNLFKSVKLEMDYYRQEILGLQINAS
ncbi:MAG: CHAT domain-containing protein [Bacteroidota bacterium]